MSDNNKSVVIGVKYCGGCNNRYDRMGAYKKIVSQCSSDTQFVPTLGHESFEFDYIIVVCGCQAQCADISQLKSKNGFFSMHQDADFDACVATIHALEEDKLKN